MGWFSWLFEKEEEPPEPPETLVLGAKLRCPYGSYDSYLHIDSENIEVNNLPKACVDDCKALYNILPFGDCYLGGLCEELMDLDEKWENPVPQGEKINGKEIITTKSLLSCKECCAAFKIIESGQDGIYAKQFLLCKEMDKKYPGLRNILNDPHGSLYLNEGMYNIAIRFIEDRVEKNGGEIKLFSLYDKDNLEGKYIKGAMGHLMPCCDTKSLVNLLSGLETSGFKNGMDAASGWDPNVINAEMIKMLRKNCKKTAERIETKPFYRWNEENKLFLSVVGEGVTNCAYGALMYYSTLGGPKNNLGRVNEPTPKEVNRGGAGTEGAGKNFKFSELTDDEIANIAKEYQKKSPIEIPEGASYKAQSKTGFEQISYKWNDGTYKYESRWHTRTPGAPETQGNTWVIQRTKPGSGGTKPYTEFLAGDDWVPATKWYDAIAGRKAGTATTEQIEILDKGHWKE